MTAAKNRTAGTNRARRTVINFSVLMRVRLRIQSQRHPEWARRLHGSGKVEVEAAGVITERVRWTAGLGALVEYSKSGIGRSEKRDARECGAE
jgi:hypothetical protein